MSYMPYMLRQKIAYEKDAYFLGGKRVRAISTIDGGQFIVLYHIGVVKPIDL